MGDDSQRLRVFISYARDDCSDFAKELSAGLELAGFDPFLDRDDIVGGEVWETRLSNLIRSADTVVFVLSPASVRSPRCADEVRKAEALSKRVIPIVAIDVKEEDTPPELRRINYIFFSSGHSFISSLATLASALRTDVEWIREHTRLGDLAARWHERAKAEPLLLRGSELEAAKTWLTAWKAPAPEPTALHREFIGESEAMEVARFSDERKRLDEVAAAQAERGHALSRFRRAVVIAAVLVAALLAATGVGGVLLLNLKGQVAASEHRLRESTQRLEVANRDLEKAKGDFALSQIDLQTTRDELARVAAQINAGRGGSTQQRALERIGQELARPAAPPQGSAPQREERRLTQHFLVADFIASETARQRGIDNTPTPEQVETIRRTTEYMERVRTLLNDCPIQIRGAFRSEALTRATGGIPQSAHSRGFAVDFQCDQYGSPRQIVERLASDADLMRDVDQLIFEAGRWVHISFEPRNPPRQQVLTAYYQPGRGQALFYVQGLQELTAEGYLAAAPAPATSP